MEGWSEWRAFPACGNISAPKVSNGGYACFFGNGVGITDLQAETRFDARRCGRRPMADGLSMASNRFDVSRLLAS